jgi:hypothetical protein
MVNSGASRYYLFLWTYFVADFCSFQPLPLVRPPDEVPRDRGSDTSGVVDILISSVMIAQFR